MKNLIKLLLIFNLILWCGYADASSIEPVNKDIYEVLVDITKYDLDCDNKLFLFAELEVVCIYYKDGSVESYVCTKAQIQRIKNKLQTFIDIRREYVRQHE